MNRTIRRLGLLDVTILLMAATLGLAWAIRNASFWQESVANLPLQRRAIAFRIPADPLHAAFVYLRDACVWMAPCASTLALGLLIVRLRRPRPRRERLFVQPGAAACGAVVLALMVRSMEVWNDQFILLFRASNSRSLWSLRDEWWDFVRFGLLDLAGLAVLTSWIGLLAIRRFRPEPSAIDRLGRAIGAFWILAMVTSWI